LSELVLKNIREGRLTFIPSVPEGIKQAEVVFICVGTPQSETGAADLSCVWDVAKEIGRNLNGYKVIATKSTVPVGTNEKIKKIIKENLVGYVDFDVVSNPEFLREGSSVEDMKKADRVVIGSDSERAYGVMKRLYQHLGVPIVECDLRSAEIIKYASNAFLATKISFINEMAQLCERSGADVTVVARGMGLDKRIGPHFLKAGIGYGGSCFPKDVAALYRTSTDQAYDFKLLRGVMEVNELQRVNFISKVSRFYGENLSGKVFAALGLAFKPDTDDARESVAIEVVKKLRGLGANLQVFDPQAMVNAKKMLGETGIKYCLDEYEALEGADAVFILTEWPHFANLDLDRARQLLRSCVIFDGRNLLNQEIVENLGFTYFAVGRKTNGTQRLEAGKVDGTSAVLRNG